MLYIRVSKYQTLEPIEIGLLKCWFVAYPIWLIEISDRSPSELTFETISPGPV